jgi:hypothetical protein
MADPMEGERRVQKQQNLARTWLLVVCTVAGCTRVRQQADPLPARPLPPIAHNEPTRRPWPVTTPEPAPAPPDAAPAVIIDTLNGDPKGLKREDINGALQQALPTLAACFQGAGPPSIGLSFDAEPDGRASHIKVTGASPEGERCVSATLGRTKLPVFEGKSVPVSFPISVFRPAEAPTPAAAAPSAAPAVPVAGAVMPAAPAPGSSNAPYVPPTMAPSPGSKPDDNQIRTFIQP